MSREQGMVLASVRMTTVIDPSEYKGAIVGYIPSDDEDAYIRERIRDAGSLAKKLKVSASLTKAELADLIAAAKTQPDENGKL